MENKMVQNSQERDKIISASEIVPKNEEAFTIKADKPADEGSVSEVDFSELFDLRVDYAFKQYFSSGSPKRLISLLNAIFENKKIPRVVTDLLIVSPNLEKFDQHDKYSILDIRATLGDGSNVIIEMQCNRFLEHRYKTLRSWSRAYGEQLETGQDYSESKPVINISFLDGSIKDSTEKPINRIHSLFNILERDNRELLLGDMELHFINMKAFTKFFEGEQGSEAISARLTKWLAIICHEGINNKRAIEKMSREDDEMGNAITELKTMSSDQAARHAYQRRLDEIRSIEVAQAKQNAIITKQADELAEKDSRLAELGSKLAEQGSKLAEQDSKLAEQGSKLAEQDAEITRLKAQLKSV
jgi:predicted transposase/invertase (TIGR01784 family)